MQCYSCLIAEGRGRWLVDKILRLIRLSSEDRFEAALPSAAVVSDAALAGSASAFESRVVTPSAAVGRALSLVRCSESWRQWPPEALRQHLRRRPKR